MKIGIDCGHTLSGDGTGSQGCGYKEQDLTRIVGKEVMRLLQMAGETVVDCTVDKSSNQLADRVRKANNANLDLFVSIHFNACVNDEKGDGRTTGTECFTYSSTSKANAPAKRILNNIASFGFKNRGLKYNGGYYVIKNTKAPGMIVEICFIDDRDDMNIYVKNVQKLAKAIAEGIIGKTITEPSKPSTNAPSGLYAVCVGAYNYENANEMKDELIKKGYKDTYLIKR